MTSDPINNTGSALLMFFNETKSAYKRSEQ